MKPPTKQNHRQYTPEERARWISRFRASGLTQVQFSQQHGLKVKTLQRWLSGRKLRSVPKLKKPGAAAKRQPSVSTFREMAMPPLWAGGGWAAEVTWPSGIRVRLGATAEAPWIGALLRRVRPAC